MKRWLPIVVLMLTAMAALAQNRDSAHLPYAEAPVAVLSQADEHAVSPEDMPLLATTAAGPSHLCGTGMAPLKGSRGGEETVPGYLRHQGAEEMIASHRPGKTVFRTYLPYTRAADHYIYFLRRIII